MEEIAQKSKILLNSVNQALGKLDIDALDAQKKQLDEQMAQPDFWQDSQKAQDISKQQAKLERRVAPWTLLKKDVEDLNELAAMDDSSMQNDLSRQLVDIIARFEKLKDELKFAGPYDDHDVILSIYAGAGGTDAQDWAQMLLRMYVRWAEGQGYTIKTIEESPGEEAGVKSVTLEVNGDYAYGMLKGEHGVHRLVRQSPFNSAASRETSFAKVDVLPKIDQPNELEIDDKDLRIDVFRAGGHGGQSVNTTDSAVRVTHNPTGISVAIQNERSQLQNKETAMTILRSRLAQMQAEQHLEQLSELKGPNKSAEWGNQIRSYVLHPYKQVKDLRTKYETSDPDKVLNGELNPLIQAYLEYSLGHA